MLDDLKWIHEKDPEDTLGIAERQCEQLLLAIALPDNLVHSDILNVVFSGMGGSALSAQIVHDTWPVLRVPFEVFRSYDVPAYLGEKTLFIASSYSGNTEETLNSLVEAEGKGAQIVIITAGGKLLDIARERNYPHVVLPRAEQPRYATFSSLKALVAILQHAGVLFTEDIAGTFAAAADHLRAAVAGWRPDVAASHNPAKQLAREMMGKSVVVYAGDRMYPAAYKWKISCNENAKHVAWAGRLPEFNHNEFLGWSKQPIDKPYVIIDLRSDLEHPRVQKRFDVSTRMLSGMRPEPHSVTAQGANLLEQVLWLIAFGDFTTLYLGLLNGVDPAPVDLVERFKKALDQ